ncbi:MAG: hypothetical protein AB7S38_11685 [Vulcanimicrobiota bacterium]
MAARPRSAAPKPQPPGADTYAATELFERQSNQEFIRTTKLSIDDPEGTLHLVSADGQRQMAFTSQGRPAAGRARHDRPGEARLSA